MHPIRIIRFTVIPQLWIYKDTTLRQVSVGESDSAAFDREEVTDTVQHSH